MQNQAFGWYLTKFVMVYLEVLTEFMLCEHYFVTSDLDTKMSKKQIQ